MQLHPTRLLLSTLCLVSVGGCGDAEQPAADDSILLREQLSELRERLDVVEKQVERRGREAQSIAEVGQEVKEVLTIARLDLRRVAANIGIKTPKSKVIAWLGDEYETLPSGKIAAWDKGAEQLELEFLDGTLKRISDDGWRFAEGPVQPPVLMDTETGQVLHQAPARPPGPPTREWIYGDRYGGPFDPGEPPSTPWYEPVASAPLVASPAAIEPERAPERKNDGLAGKVFVGMREAEVLRILGPPDATYEWDACLSWNLAPYPSDDQLVVAFKGGKAVGVDAPNRSSGPIWGYVPGCELLQIDSDVFFVRR